MYKELQTQINEKINQKWGFANLSQLEGKHRSKIKFALGVDLVTKIEQTVNHLLSTKRFWHEHLYIIYNNIIEKPKCLFCQKSYVRYDCWEHGYSTYCMKCVNKANAKTAKNQTYNLNHSYKLFGITKDQTIQETFQIIETHINLKLDSKFNHHDISQLQDPYKIYLNQTLGIALEVLVRDTTKQIAKDETLLECIYIIVNKIYKPIMCSYCHVNPTTFKTWKKGYAHLCGPACVSRTDEYKETRKNTAVENHGSLKNAYDNSKTMMKKYGVSNPSYSKEIIERKEQNNIKKYGKRYSWMTNQ